ncbi:hypothetical protein TeGR_g8649 [Tetraparma gracilis]|uniref:SAP domain-containing protein n=2 Tax=Tetraparma gracilis TaxID=2962635 RepID=A0ABQ6MGP3_9STRA|nr:hypothetical protein TeGR_g8649 [Tetraparma gracilis]
MGDSLSTLFKSAKKAKQTPSKKVRTSFAADMTQSLNDLFLLKEEIETGAATAPTPGAPAVPPLAPNSLVAAAAAIPLPKSAVKPAAKRMSIAADMAESLCGLFAEPVASAKKSAKKASKRLSLAADMGDSLDVLFAEPAATPAAQQLTDKLQELLFKEEAPANGEEVATCLVELIQTTAGIVAEDESAAASEKSAARSAKKRRERTVRRTSLAPDIGNSLNRMFNVDNREKKGKSRRQSLAADMGEVMGDMFYEKEAADVVEFLNEVEAVTEIVGEGAEEGAKDSSFSLAVAVDAILDVQPADVQAVEEAEAAAEKEQEEEQEEEEEMVAEEEVVEKEAEAAPAAMEVVEAAAEEVAEKEVVEEAAPMEVVEEAAPAAEEVEEKEVVEEAAPMEVEAPVEAPAEPVAAELEAEEEEEAVDYSSLKVAELRKLCEERGMDTKGVKAVLVKRLEEGPAAAASPKRKIEEVEDAAAEEPAAKKLEVETPNFAAMKVAELRKECEARDLDSKGVKAVLVKRLEAYDPSAAPAAESSEEEEEQEEEEGGEEDVPDFAAMKVAELRKECEARGIDSKGVKAVLVKRLEAHDPSAAPAAESSEEEEEEQEEEGGEEDVPDFAAMKVAELRKECEARDLDTKGVKAVLIKRLQEAVA